jgi:hypothetical protein
MSLRLDWKSVKNYEIVCEMDNPDNPGHRTNTPVVFAMGVLMMHTGIGHLTHQNAEEFYVRARLVEVCFGGGLLTKRGKTVGITPEDVYAHIGLKANVSTYTPAQFYKHLREDVVRELREHYRYIAKQREAEVKVRVMATVEGDQDLRRLAE